MFKLGSLEDEIYRSMEQKLNSSKAEQTFSLNKLERAADFLSRAANLFEQAGMRKEADQVLSVLQSFTKKLSQ